MPGSTTQVRFSTSSERMRFRCLEKSTTIPVVDGLAALRGPAAARGDDQALVPGDGKRPQRLVHGPGNHHAQGQDLVERGVGRVAAAVEGVEEDVARNLAGKTRGKALFSAEFCDFSAPVAAITLISWMSGSVLPAGVRLGKAKPCFLCIDGPRRAGDKPAK